MNTAQRDMFDTQIRLEDQLIDMGAETNAVNRQQRVNTYTNHTIATVYVKTNAGNYQRVNRGETVTAPQGEYYVKIQQQGTSWKSL